MSASSGAQVKQLESIDEAAGLLLHIEGPNRLWLRSVQTHYFSLKMSKQDSSDDPADEGTCEYRTVLDVYSGLVFAMSARAYLVSN